MTFKYKTFNSSEEFEKWQKERDFSRDSNHIKITQILPILLKFDIKQEMNRDLGGTEKTNAEAAVSPYGVFVVYYEN